MPLLMKIAAADSDRSAASVLRVGLKRPNIYIPECHRAMVGLQHEWIFAGLWYVHRGTSRSGRLDLALDNLAVVFDPQKLRITDLLSGTVEPWSAEPDVKRLPLARRSARVHRRRRAADTLTINPSLIY